MREFFIKGSGLRDGIVFNPAGIANRPAGHSLNMAFDPPTVEDTEARHSIERGFHAACAGSFLWPKRRIEPNVDTRTKQLTQRHVVIFEINDANIVCKGCGRLENAPNDRLTAFVARVGFTGVNDLHRPRMASDLFEPFEIGKK